MEQPQQTSFNFEAVVKGKEKKAKKEPFRTATIGGLRFDFYETHAAVSCADCGALNMPFAIIYNGKGRCVARRHACTSRECLYKILA